MTDVFSLYKPLKNNLKKMELEASLLGIHAHMQFQLFRTPLPTYIVGEPEGYRSCHKFYDFMNFHLMPWELALLCNELIINAEGYKNNKSFLNWYYLSSSVNRLKELEDGISSLYSNSDNVMIEINNRIPHRQFKWQRIPKLDLLARYWEIYKYPALRKIVESKIGLNLEDIFKIGLAFLGTYMDKIALYYPPKIKLTGIDQDKVDKFLKHFSLDIYSLKKRLIQERSLDEKFAYSHSSLVAFPIIRMEYGQRDALVCPITKYLYERFTSGVYYEIYNEIGFDNAFGEAFQKYIGEILSSFFPEESIYPDEEYGVGKRTVDWIVEDQSAVLFIECKTKRLAMGAKSELTDDSKLKNQMMIMAENIAKVYKTLSDFIKNKYPSIQNKDKDLYPIIVTLENWYFFGDKLNAILFSELEPYLRENPKLRELIKKYPFSIVPTETFEQLIPISKKHGIKTTLADRVKDKEFGLWDVETFLQKTFPTEFGTYKNPFIEQTLGYIDNII